MKRMQGVCIQFRPYKRDDKRMAILKDLTGISIHVPT